MLEMKKMRDKMSFYKGLEQVIALNEEIKQELATIKRVEAVVERHADKVETVFIEVEKKFAEFDKFNDTVKDVDKSFKKLQSDFEKIRVRIEMKLERKDFLDLLDKFNDFEKHTTNLLKLLDERNKTTKDDIEVQFKGLEAEYRKKLEAMRPQTKSLPPIKPSGLVASAVPVAATVDGAAVQEPTAQPTTPPPAVELPSGEDGAGRDAAGAGMVDKMKGLFSKKKAE